MVSYSRIESENYTCVTNVYVKPKDSKMFIDLQNNFSLYSESVAKIFINKHKYEYEWYDIMLNPGDIIKYEIIRTYKTKNGEKNRKEIHYYLVKKNSKFINESVFPTVAGDVYELDGDYKNTGEIKNELIKN